ncbi:MAG: glycosyltransferase [Chloroflexota bacterium]
MRIAMLSYHTCPLATLGGKDTGGMNVYVRDFTRQLGSMGICVDVYTRSQDEHVPHVLHDLGYGNRVVHVPSGPEVPLPKPELAAYLPEFVEGVSHFTQDKGLKYDLIHSHYWLSGMAARDLKNAWGVPLVHMFHTLGEMKKRVEKEGEAESNYRIEAEREVISIADRIIVATVAELAQLQWLYQADTKRMVIIPPGVDLSRFYPIPKDEAKEYLGVPQEHCMLLFVGRIEPLKGLTALIQALALMRERGKFPDHHLFLSIIGGDPSVPVDETTEMGRLRAYCEQYGLEDVVAFLGKRSQDTLPYYYSAAEVVVVPSHYESFGMVALEAMACSTPVVASQVGGLAYLVQDGVTGFHVPDGDPEALAARLTTLMGDHELRLRMGEQAAVYARDFSWERIAPRIVDVYQQLLSGK